MDMGKQSSSMSIHRTGMFFLEIAVNLGFRMDVFCLRIAKVPHGTHINVTQMLWIEKSQSPDRQKSFLSIANLRPPGQTAVLQPWLAGVRQLRLPSSSQHTALGVSEPDPKIFPLGNSILLKSSALEIQV
ncbi:hypothetical protein BTVI_97261 [Pitangus sulphuratus]|nr:hypothetical protein BTVI_97261 [Pitangus sulphuratus]